MTEVYDVVVLGGGPAGYVGAIRAAQLGARVALIEAAELGGTCLNEGCIPTKTLLHSARLLRQIKDSARFGITLPGPPLLDLSQLRQRKADVIGQLVRGVRGLLKSHRVDVLRGHGRLQSPGRIAVQPAEGAQQVLSFKHLLVATGTEAISLPLVAGLPPQLVLDSRSGLEMDSVPPRLLIIGGGFIGIEFASIYSGLGSAVTVVEALPRVLTGADA